MEHDTGDTAIRVSHRTARESIRRLQTALETLDIHADRIRQINLTSDLAGNYHIRMGNWDPGSVEALADAVEGLHEALHTIEILRRPPLIGRPDAPPQLPASS